MGVQKLRKGGMANKARKNSIFVVYEGHREEIFLEYLGSLSNVRLNTLPNGGGSADQIVNIGIIRSARDIKVYAFFDEDFETRPEYNISDETIESLAKSWKCEKGKLKGCPYNQLQTLNMDMQNPILIISHPKSIEGLILRLLNRPLDTLEEKTTTQLKGEIASFLDSTVLTDEDRVTLQFYDRKISNYLEKIKIIQQNDPQDKKQPRYLEGKIKDYQRRKNKVTFMRFLNEKLPLSVMTAKRRDILEIDILLSAFGL